LCLLVLTVADVGAFFPGDGDPESGVETDRVGDER